MILALTVVGMSLIFSAVRRIWARRVRSMRKSAVCECRRRTWSGCQLCGANPDVTDTVRVGIREWLEPGGTTAEIAAGFQCQMSRGLGLDAAGYVTSSLIAAGHNGAKWSKR